MDLFVPEDLSVKGAIARDPVVVTFRLLSGIPTCFFESKVA